jgi:phosphoribosylanthranilate isomerase
VRKIFVKICGITNLDDAFAAADAGADAIGLNLIPGSRRFVPEPVARSITDAVGERLLVVGVVADLPLERLRALQRELSLGALQLHGHESPELLAQLLPDAYKAVRIGGSEDVRTADSYAGQRLLVDSKHAGSLGGSGRAFDHGLVAELARRRPLILAGGLTAENVAEAIARIAPFGVDVATGVEQPGEPRRKQPERMARFVRAARG